jgi:hypothetical protein
VQTIGNQDSASAGIVPMPRPESAGSMPKPEARRTGEFVENTTPERQSRRDRSGTLSSATSFRRRTGREQILRRNWPAVPGASKFR